MAVIFRKIFTALTSPVIWLVCLGGIIITELLTLNGIEPLTYGTQLQPQFIQSFAFSPNGLLALSQYDPGTSYLYCADMQADNLKWLLREGDLAGYCGSASRRNMVLAEDGTLFLHYVTWTNDNNAIQTESIMRITPEGKPESVLCGIDYTRSDDPPTRKPRFTALRYDAGILHFALLGTQETIFYTVDTHTGTQVQAGKIEWDGIFAGGVFPAENGGYLLLLTDGTLCRADENGTLGETLYQCTVSPEDLFDTDMIVLAAEMGGNIYVTAECGLGNTVYRIDGNDMEECFDLGGLLDTDSRFNAVTGMQVQGDTLYLTTGKLLAAWNGGEPFTVQTAYSYGTFDLYNRVMYTAEGVFLVGFAVFFCIWAVCKRKGILAKQLVLMVPCISVMMYIIYLTAQKCIMRAYFEKFSDEMIAVCDLCAGRFDGETLAEVSRTGDYATAYLQQRDILMGCAGYNRGYWNGTFDFLLCLPCGDNWYYVLADSRELGVPCKTVEYIELDEDNRMPGTNIYFSAYYETEQNRFQRLTSAYQLDTYEVYKPIFAEDGSIAAILCTTTDHYALQNDQQWYRDELLIAMLPLGLLLLGLTSGIAILVSHSIRRATATVEQIADGNFSVRTRAHSHDEIGEICRQVEKMADSLSTLFAEKDANEQFYYKFVPEKFRELLGKEKFTDLALGDAESREFTVLFCDIRSFSLNSEMLTAKENFEFVNVIYGIAGPIIREHGGFVDKYIGDAVMALFESADAAVTAGMELYRAIVLDPSTAERLHVSEIHIGVGIHTGMARIGIVGEEERLSGTVISDTVNLSSRLESLTKTYQTAMLISKDTLDKMEYPERIHTRYLGLVQVAGVNEVKSLYEVLDALDGERQVIRTANSTDFREAVRLFHIGKRAEAADLLEQIVQAGKADHVVEMYLEYIRSLSADDRGNVFRFVRK